MSEVNLASNDPNYASGISTNNHIDNFANPIAADNSILNFNRKDCNTEYANFKDANFENQKLNIAKNGDDNRNSQMKNIHCDQVGRVQSGEALQPLAGFFLPKTPKQWGEMNAYFHSSALFRLASGKIDNLDSATAEFNNSIYDYLAKTHGMLRGKKKLSARGERSDTALDQKYQSWSKSRIRRELNKLKHKKPVIQGSPICDEIIYLSHRLRQDLQSRSRAAKPVSDGSFGTDFCAV